MLLSTTMYSLAILAWLVVTATADTTQITANVTSDVHITATPTDVIESLTKDLTINCSFVNEPNSDFSTVMSIIVSKEDFNGVDFRELATMSMTARDTVQVQDSLGAHVTGHLDANGDSYILFKWTYPDSQVQGQYRCEAYGMDSAGHPRVSSDAVEVSSRIIGDGDGAELLTQNLKECHSKETSLQAQLDDLKSRVNASKNTWVVATGQYNGHQYYLSYVMPQDVPMARSQCELYDSYLAEIDTKEEYEWVVGFVNANAGNEFIGVGSTDSGHEGAWTFMRSGQPMTYFKWSVGEPQGTGQEFLFLGPNSQRLYYDGPMVLHQTHLRFLCEVDL